MKAVILGIKGVKLTEEEKDFFQKVNPVGFILFARNLESSLQIRELIQDLRNVVGRENLPILIDQEGGRVQRLGPRLGYKKYPVAADFGKIAADQEIHTAGRECYENFYQIGVDLLDLGININCAPCVDLFYQSAHSVIGDRSFSDNPEIVANLGKAAIDGLKEAGVMPIIKHIPGHGAALKDSHFDLPVVELSIEELSKKDLIPFQSLAKHANIAMTAHICYTSIDPDLPITLSEKGIKFIRENIGFDGVIISDDIAMKALKGSLQELTQKAYNAGCDLILHCNGEIEEMKQVVSIDLPINDRVQTVLLNENSKLAQIKANKNTGQNNLINIAKNTRQDGYER